MLPTWILWSDVYPFAAIQQIADILNARRADAARETWTDVAVKRACTRLGFADEAASVIDS